MSSVKAKFGDVFQWGSLVVMCIVPPDNDTWTVTVLANGEHADFDVVDFAACDDFMTSEFDPDHPSWGGWEKIS